MQPSPVDSHDAAHGVREENPANLDILLQAGAEVDLTSSEGSTAMHRDASREPSRRTPMRGHAHMRSRSSYVLY
jgi:hypothetical protein